MKLNNNVTAPCSAVPGSHLCGQLRWPTTCVENYLFLVPFQIPNSSDFRIQNTESDLYKKVRNGNGIGNELCAQVGTRGREFRFRL